MAGFKSELPSLAFRLVAILAAILVSFGSGPARAVEGGAGAYFLGARDTFAGVVPPPGTYLSFSYDRLEGSVEGLSVGGLPIRADADVSVNLFRVGITQSFDTTFLGGRPALSVSFPFPDTTLSYTAVTPPLDGQAVRDEVFGLGDIGVTGLLGWNDGPWNYLVGLTVFAPTGRYNTASVNIPDRSIDALSTGKNVWSFQPVVAATWFNPATGFEVSGAASLLIGTKNNATDYQTAPAFQFEAAVVQRFQSGWGVGLAGYTYHQLGDDSGQGAVVTRNVLGAPSLRAQVSGIGPIITYSGGQIFGGAVSVKAKVTREFYGKRRLESDIFSFGLSLAY